jgi:hypothetical protein
MISEGVSWFDEKIFLKETSMCSAVQQTLANPGVG